jgi:hypothetical protein
MIEDQLKRIAAWFDSFTATFKALSPEAQRNYDLKTEHTVRVRSVMERLTDSLSLSAEEQALAAIIAVCHDVGRFPQYRNFGTFNDATSVNHATLALQTLKEEGILADLPEGSRSLILQAIALHNAFSLPDNLDPSLGRFARLIRDADKLDIWRVLIEYCSAAPLERASAVIWELPETGLCSDSAIHEVIAGRMVHRNLLATADDFKLLQLSWAYDLNFRESFVILAERRYLETLSAFLPDQPGCRDAAHAVQNFVKNSV